jgi:hypothetical protein
MSLTNTVLRFVSVIYNVQLLVELFGVCSTDLCQTVISIWRRDESAGR